MQLDYVNQFGVITKIPPIGTEHRNHWIQTVTKNLKEIYKDDMKNGSPPSHEKIKSKSKKKRRINSEN